MRSGHVGLACAPRGAVCEIAVGALVVLSMPAGRAALGNGSAGAVFNNRNWFCSFLRAGM